MFRLLSACGVALCGLIAVAAHSQSAPPAASPAFTPPDQQPIVQRPPVLATVAMLQNWAVGCDNNLACEASSLMPDEGETDPAGLDMVMTVGFTISAPPTASAKMEVLVQRQLPERAYVLVVPDSQTVVHKFASLKAMETAFTIDAKAMKALASGTSLLLEDADGGDYAKVSLAGFRDVLLKAQAAQKSKADARTIVRLPKGNIPRAPAMEPTPKEVMDLRRRSECTVSKGDWQDKIIAPLDRSTTLILLSCGAGAYNYSYAPFVGRIREGRRSFDRAAFDLSPMWGEEGGPAMLVNPAWDGKTSTLSIFSKGRGIGDCGASQSWVWTGGRFTLSLVQSMSECRGSQFWPTVWRADVRDSAADAPGAVVPSAPADPPKK